MLLKMLKNLGYKDVTAIGSAEEAVSLINNDNFDLLLLDWNLPKLSGFDFLKYLKKNDKTAQIPVIMITTVQERSNILQAIKLGICGYIIKPINKILLLSKIKEVELKMQSSSL